ncbi:mammalian cell entry protein [Rhodococcus hoagii]|nr:mammalian cell entry protein [Prescottella equi]
MVLEKNSSSAYAQPAAADHGGEEAAPQGTQFPSPAEPNRDGEFVSVEPSAGRSRAHVVLAVLAGVVIVALIAAITVMLIDRKQASDLAAERADYVSVARQTAINISTLRSDSAKEDLDKLFEGTTGPLREDLDARLNDFANVVSKLNVSTTGEVVEAGLESEDGNCKTSLVAVSANQKNADAAPVGKSFRLRVVICDEGGKLLASNVEFVP